MNKIKPTIGIIGAGRLGAAVGKQALKAGYAVTIANSQNPESLTLILNILLPGAKAAKVKDLIFRSDIIILAIPLNKYKTLLPDLFANKIVIDAMNYWPITEGSIPKFENKTISSSEYIQSYFSKAKVIKTLNHIAYNELEEHSLPPGKNNRRAIVIAGNDPQTKSQITEFINDLGFDPVDLGSLPEGRRFQPNTDLFNTRFTAEDITTST
ncbi:MAG TPA: NAD(P)-binding domain-containing protein [Candidatus Saccharimonadales bacterium]|nr:NAD(P)-binding domain-containing protein [Candidatus Saccharimonadales bacterium]